MREYKRESWCDDSQAFESDMEEDEEPTIHHENGLRFHLSTGGQSRLYMYVGIFMLTFLVKLQSY